MKPVRILYDQTSYFYVNDTVFHLFLLIMLSIAKCCSVLLDFFYWLIKVFNRLSSLYMDLVCVPCLFLAWCFRFIEAHNLCSIIISFIDIKILNKLSVVESDNEKRFNTLARFNVLGNVYQSLLGRSNRFKPHGWAVCFF